MTAALYTVLLFPFLTLSFSTAIPRRDVPKFGPEGTVNVLTRWRDAVGTATQVWWRGRVPRLTTVVSLRSGPLSPVYQATISSNATSQRCEVQENKKCEISINGFGTVGEVAYTFVNRPANIKGRSTQVQVACRCLAKECGVAVLIRPVNIWTTENGVKRDTKRRICVYEEMDGFFSDCHSELLRVSYRGKDRGPEYYHEKGHFNYSVQSGENGEWNAEGQRGYTYDCLEEDIAKLEEIDFSKVTNETIRFNKHSTEVNNGCKAPKGTRYYKGPPGDSCIEVYDQAISSATHIGSAQDEIAVGNMKQSYRETPPELVADTELALSCSAAGIGVVFVWTMCRKLFKKQGVRASQLARVLVAQVIVLYVLEALPLHIALVQELRARAWHSLFAFADATLSLEEAVTGPEGSAFGSVLILTVVLGEVEYNETREGLIGGLTAVFNLAAVGIIVISLLLKFVPALYGIKLQLGSKGIKTYIRSRQRRASGIRSGTRRSKHSKQRNLRASEQRSLKTSTSSMSFDSTPRVKGTPSADLSEISLTIDPINLSKMKGAE